MFRTLLNEKIGNLLCYLATKIAGLSLTKALKLLYLIDEVAVKETGTPITWLEYKVWKNGPVADEIYKELRHRQKIAFNNQILSLDKFIRIEQRESNFSENQVETYLYPHQTYDFSAFSEYEIALIEEVVQSYGHLSARELIEILHQENTLWHKIVEANGLKTNFELFKATSNYTIDFTELIKEDEMLKLAAQSAYESLQFQENLIANNAPA